MTDLIILNRNLRLHDNPAMHFGSLRSNYLVIYLYDKTYWKGNGKSMRQLKFSNDCLAELNDGLKKFDSKVNIFEGTFNDLKIWIKKNFNDFFIHINHCTDIKYFRDGFSKFTDSFPKKLTLFLILLFCILRISMLRKHKFIEKETNIFLNGMYIKLTLNL